MGKIPLALVNSDSFVCVSGIQGKDKIKNHMLQQGLIENALVHVIKNNNGEPLIIEVNGTRLALGRSAAFLIMVEEIKDPFIFKQKLGKTNLICETV